MSHATLNWAGDGKEVEKRVTNFRGRCYIHMGLSIVF